MNKKWISDWRWHPLLDHHLEPWPLQHSLQYIGSGCATDQPPSNWLILYQETIYLRGRRKHFDLRTQRWHRVHDWKTFLKQHRPSLHFTSIDRSYNDNYNYTSSPCHQTIYFPIESEVIISRLDIGASSLDDMHRRYPTWKRSAR